MTVPDWAADVEFPPSWRPDQGDANPLIGEVVRYGTGTTKRGVRSLMVVRDSQDELWTVWLMHSALAAAVGREQPQIGEVVFIRRDAAEPVVSRKSGQPYVPFTFRIDRPPELPDFDALAAGELDPEPHRPARPAEPNGSEPDVPDGDMPDDDDPIPF